MTLDGQRDALERIKLMLRPEPKEFGSGRPEVKPAFSVTIGSAEPITVQRRLVVLFVRGMESVLDRNADPQATPVACDAAVAIEGVFIEVPTYLAERFS